MYSESRLPNPGGTLPSTRRYWSNFEHKGYKFRSTSASFYLHPASFWPANSDVSHLEVRGSQGGEPAGGPSPGRGLVGDGPNRVGWSRSRVGVGRSGRGPTLMWGLRRRPGKVRGGAGVVVEPPRVVQVPLTDVRAFRVRVKRHLRARDLRPLVRVQPRLGAPQTSPFVDLGPPRRGGEVNSEGGRGRGPWLDVGASAS